MRRRELSQAAERDTRTNKQTLDRTETERGRQRHRDRKNHKHSRKPRGGDRDGDKPDREDKTERRELNKITRENQLILKGL